jgi:8-oxo-dGTP diphosphatase
MIVLRRTELAMRLAVNRHALMASTAAAAPTGGPVPVRVEASVPPVSLQIGDSVTNDDSQPVNLRCSAVVFRGDAVLLCHRPSGVWVLPGGSPRPGEGMAACVRREVREETGLRVEPKRVAFLLEATNREMDQHVIDIVFHAVAVDPGAQPQPQEPNLDPRFVALADLGGLTVRPPIVGHLRSLHAAPLDQGGVYLGNVWRPDHAGAGGGAR